MRKHSLIAAFAVLLAGIGGIAAQTYPSRPITIVVAFAAGGSGDTITRILADQAYRKLLLKHGTRSEAEIAREIGADVDKLGGIHINARRAASPSRTSCP